MDDSLAELSHMWTDEKDAWYLVRTKYGLIPIRRGDPESGLIIEDDDVAIEVCRRMAEAGVEIREWRKPESRCGNERLDQHSHTGDAARRDGEHGMRERWLLMSDDKLVGSIDVIGADQPWLTGHFNPESAFAEFADDFSRELALVEGNLDERLAEWEEAYRRIQDRLRLVKPDGTVVPEYLLHISDGDAWFRYSDEPFDP